MKTSHRLAVALAGLLLGLLSACGDEPGPGAPDSKEVVITRVDGPGTVEEDPSRFPENSTPYTPQPDVSIASPDPDGTVFDGTLYVADGTLRFLTGGATGDSAVPESFIDPALSFAGQTNGLLGAAQPGMFITVAAALRGDIPYKIQVLDHQPVEEDEWEDVVEASFTPEAGVVRVWNVHADDLAAFPVEKSTSYRVRLSANGMDAAAEEVVLEDGEIIDGYLLQLWPVPTAPDAILEEGSKIAAYWHTRGWRQP